jgi:hypothetical protein
MTARTLSAALYFHTLFIAEESGPKFDIRPSIPVIKRNYECAVKAQ